MHSTTFCHSIPPLRLTSPRLIYAPRLFGYSFRLEKGRSSSSPEGSKAGRPISRVYSRKRTTCVQQFLGSEFGSDEIRQHTGGRGLSYSSPHTRCSTGCSTMN